jgi:hypothetical protein
MKLKTIGYAAVLGAIAVTFAIGSGGTSLAKTKKAAAQQQGSCNMEPKQVCGAKGGMKITYASGCYAVNDGAKVVSQGACKAGKAYKKAAKKTAAPAKAAAPAKKEEKKK